MPVQEELEGSGKIGFGLDTIGKIGFKLYHWIIGLGIDIIGKIGHKVCDGQFWCFLAKQGALGRPVS